ncbi:hypothetical protein BD626DRAFT_509806 [Schizophyllum amplum]|uniref:F-box domain-containing protein n=1 Tax=Schizophyllum amplum TaxID=97359 RepID=A0A550C2A1_9AGAR|nr:hypothetical protein BD626DRAFT_509806 [Auriculariopsis ampla]
MHEALLIADILGLVFNDNALHPADLYRCALVCRHWRDTAVSKLWEDVDFENLLRLFPLDRDDPDTISGDGHGALFRDLNLFSSHAMSVRRLTVSLKTVPEIEQRSIACLTYGAIMYPSLQHLFLEDHPQDGRTDLVLDFIYHLLNDRANNTSESHCPTALLRSFQSKNIPIPDVLRILRMRRARHLHSVRITAAIVHSNDLSYISRSLRETMDTHTFREVTVARTLQSFPPPRDMPLSLEHLRSLSSFRHLTRVEFINFGVAALGDIEYAACAAWWPQLRVFSVEPPVSTEPREPCTLEAVEAFARKCPDLERLSLPLQSIIPPEYTPALPLRSRPAPAVTIYAGGGRMAMIGDLYWQWSDDPAAKARHLKNLAVYLLALFPELECVYKGTSTDLDPDWDMYGPGKERGIWMEFAVSLAALKGNTKLG